MSEMVVRYRGKKDHKNKSKLQFYIVMKLFMGTLTGPKKSPEIVVFGNKKAFCRTNHKNSGIIRYTSAVALSVFEYVLKFNIVH